MIPEGSPETLMQRLIDYVERVEPGWHERIQPAEPELMARYVEVAQLTQRGLTLPLSYRLVAEAMGRGSGDLLETMNWRLRLDQIVEAYEWYMRKEPEEIVPELPIVATYLLGEDIALDLRRGVGEPCVVETSDFQEPTFLARSWEHFMFHYAVLYVEVRRLPVGYTCRGTPTLAVEAGIAALDAVVARHGLKKSWLCDEAKYIVLSEDLSIFASLRRSSGIWVQVCAVDPAKARAIRDEMMEALQARDSGRMQRIDGVLRVV